MRPRLEVLESRELPQATATSVLGVSSQYGILSQKETVTVAVNAAGTTLGPRGNVAVVDGGQVKTIAVTNGMATAVFTFPFQAEMPPAHSISASFSDPGGVFDPSSAATNSPNTTAQFYFQIAFDVALIEGLLAVSGQTPPPAAQNATTTG